MEYKKDLFGAKSPWQGWQEGSLLNNFLCSKAGKPCIVFLDEFEKCGKDVHEALLLPFDQGKSQVWPGRLFHLIKCSRRVSRPTRIRKPTD
jgi:ATP-dependent Clp protease ATP-binding subunit ClpA